MVHQNEPLNLCIKLARGHIRGYEDCLSTHHGDDGFLVLSRHPHRQHHPWPVEMGEQPRRRLGDFSDDLGAGAMVASEVGVATQRYY